MILRLPPTHPVGQSVVNRLIGLPLNAAARRSGDGLKPTLPMGNGPDGLRVPEARYCAAIDNLEDASFGLDCGVGRLVEKAPHVAVAIGRSVALIDSPTLLVTRAGANPRGEMLSRRKGRCGGTDFSNDLLRRVHTQTGYLRQPADGVFVLAEQAGHLLVQLADLLLEELQLLQHHFQQPSIHGLEVRARAERIT